MRARRRPHQVKSMPAPDMGPFLGVLLCLLGALTMLLSTVVLVSVGPGKTFGVSSGELQRINGRTPHIVVWDGRNVLLLPGNVLVPGPTALRDFGKNDSPFGELLKTVEQKRATDYIMFAVRPSGFHNFGPLKYVAMARKIDIGYEPFSQTARLVVTK